MIRLTIKDKDYIYILCGLLDSLKSALHDTLREKMPIEMRTAKFNQLLQEHNISAFSTFEREQPKLEKDERWLLVSY